MALQEVGLFIQLFVTGVNKLHFSLLPEIVSRFLVEGVT
jgi:hypothetical protein